MLFRFTTFLDRGCRVQMRPFPATSMRAPGLHVAWSLALTCIVMAPMLIAHGPGGEWLPAEALHQGILSRCRDAVMLTLVGWPNSVAMAADLATAGERGLPMLLVPRRQPRTPSSAHVATEAKS